MDLAYYALRVGAHTVVVGVPVAYFVYTDARRRGVDRPRAWAVGAGLLGVVGLLAYLAGTGRLAPDRE